MNVILEFFILIVISFDRERKREREREESTGPEFVLFDRDM